MSGGGGGTGGGGGGGGGGTTGNETWADGKTIASSVVVKAGATVTIAAGATITIAQGASITVQGTLVSATQSATHAKLTGADWAGVVVAKGGSMTLDGVDIVGAHTAIDSQGGAGAVEFDGATIDGATVPFHVEEGGVLVTKKTAVTNTKGTTSIAGTFTASHLDYASGGHEGISTTGPGAILSIEDSVLHGTGPSGDMITAGPAGAKSIHVAYTEITNVHCGFHFDSIDAFDVSYTSVHGNAWGFMLYGSGGAGPHSVTYSNVDLNSDYAYETSGTNGPITFDHCYVTGLTAPGNVVTESNPEQAAIATAKPRAQ